MFSSLFTDAKCFMLETASQRLQAGETENSRGKAGDFPLHSSAAALMFQASTGKSLHLEH